MKFGFIFLFVILVILTSCKKKVAETRITGSVNSTIENKLVDGAHVKYFVKSLAGNSYSSTFKLFEELNVSYNGQFSFSFLKTSSDVEYKLVLSHLGYKTEEVLINPSSVDAGVENKLDQNLIPFGIVNFHIKAGLNSALTDEILFNFNNYLEGGVSFVNQLFTGNQVDTLLITTMIAEKFNKFNYVLKRNGMFLSVQDSVFCSKENTVQKNIEY